MAALSAAALSRRVSPLLNNERNNSKDLRRKDRQVPTLVSGEQLKKPHLTGQTRRCLSHPPSNRNRGVPR
eukprot:436922-Amphidinium_carterae.1